MERSEIRAALACRTSPGLRCAPSGLRTSIIPSPSLRGAQRRSNPESLRRKILDCFAALAMTCCLQARTTPRRSSKRPLARRATHPHNPAPRLSSPAAANIPLYRNSDLSYKRNTLARDKGRIAIVTNRGLGSDGRDGVGREARCRAGNREQQGFAHTTRR